MKHEKHRLELPPKTHKIRVKGRAFKLGSDAAGEPVSRTLPIKSISLSTRDLRIEFLRKLQRHEPDILASLADAPYSALLASGSPRQARVIADWRLVPANRGLAQLRQAILDWAQKWRFSEKSEKWMFDVVIYTLSGWALNPNAPREWQLPFLVEEVPHNWYIAKVDRAYRPVAPDFPGAVQVVPETKFTFRAAEPGEVLGAYLSEVCGAAKQHWMRVYEHAKAAGFKRMPERRLTRRRTRHARKKIPLSQRETSRIDHVEWFILHRFKNQSFYEIAKTQSDIGNQQAVSRAVRKVAEKLELLRDPPNPA